VQVSGLFGGRCFASRCGGTHPSSASEVESQERVGESETVGELLERWFEIAEASWTPWTVVQHRSVINSYLAPGLGDIQIRSLGVHAIDQFYAGLHRSGGRWGKPLAPATVRRIRAVLRRALQQAGAG
jgi:hypothetical protein